MIGKALSSLLLLTPVVDASVLVRSQLDIYKTILGDKDTISKEELVELMVLHDDDNSCVGACDRFLDETFGGKPLTWSAFETLIDNIYGDAISDDPYQPQEIHLAITDDASEMKVMWATMKNLEAPFVEVLPAGLDWETAANQVQTVTAVNFTYQVQKNWWPIFTGVLYEADMSGLQAGAAYQYRVGGTQHQLLQTQVRRSQDFQFKAAPAPDPNRRTVIGCLADQGTWMLLGFATSNKLAEVQDELGVDMVMYAGDLAYAGLSSAMPRLNISKEDEFEHIWDLWGIQTQPVAATRPFMVGVGNHERFYEYAAVQNRYKMPFEKSGGNGDFWYSYTYGNVHWISISSEEDVEPDSTQISFLQQDLEKAAANRAAVPWIVVSLHRPMYCSTGEGSEPDYGPNSKYQTALEPLLLQYDVDLVIQGHMHAYERMHPSVNGEAITYPEKLFVTGTNEAGEPQQQEVDLYRAQGKGPVYVVQGNSGAMQFERWANPRPDWSAVRFANGFVPPGDVTRDPVEEARLQGLILHSNYSDTFGFGVMTVMNATHMQYKVVPVTGTVGTDEFWVVKRV